MQLSDFTWRAVNEEQASKITVLTQAFEDLVTDIEGMVSASAHRTAALRKLLEAKMTVIHAITHPIENTQR
jgi:hypothetical protein